MDQRAAALSQIAMGKLAAGLALKHPEVRLEITTEDRPVDMAEEAYDLVIRVNPQPDANLVGRVFLHDRLVVVASLGLAPSSDGTAIRCRRAWDRPSHDLGVHHPSATRAFR